MCFKKTNKSTRLTRPNSTSRSMILWRRLLLLHFFIFFLPIVLLQQGIVSAILRNYTPPAVPTLTNIFRTNPTWDVFSIFYGVPYLQLSGATLSLTKTSGSGLVSREMFSHGFFSAAIRLPSGFTSGVVVAFYLSNAETFPKTHDEIDIELLGHENGKEWVLQTNIYCNGDTSIGREEKFNLWFDPSEHPHQYTIIWNNNHIVYLVDNVPVREVVHGSAAYPLKPMYVYATIWDGSEWATNGGKSPVDYTYAPFTASLSEVKMEGCVVPRKQPASICLKTWSPGSDPIEGLGVGRLTMQQSYALKWARDGLMFYSYCRDSARFKVVPPGCPPP